MELSFSTKIVVVALLVSVCSAQTNARRLYKWVDQTSVTNYSEFQPKEGTSRKLEVIESRGDEHIDPMMAVTNEMKAIEIPVDPMNLQDTSSGTASQAPKATTQTIVKQGVLAAQPYVSPVNGVVASSPVEKKEQPTAVVEKKETVVNPIAEKASSSVAVIDKPSSSVVVEKKDEPATVARPDHKKTQQKINPWSRSPNFVPSNLVPENLPKSTTP
ncbi:hypothetical protein [Acinetobacter venetianus]|uniref:hypothetical protein n=1 Tax=Acinetobacter venetianus TaxID=52133 RepID=UPI0007785F91|nr:hypothetical protein [Acinetobacter venetianus]KXZ64886.1 hypothetical protein AVENLUH7437_01617 [Acinetobacter venetianus]